jgi:hypothetical protein
MSKLRSFWRKLNGKFTNHELGFYTYETFKNIPSIPGFYAWFYPLQIHSRDLDEFIRVTKMVLDYDASSKGLPSVTGTLNFNWDELEIESTLKSKKQNLDKFRSIWLEYCSNDDKLSLLNETLHKASFILPPLYVGKATNLYERCQQHLRGGGEINDFHFRYQSHAKNNNIPLKSISDLLFVCIKSGETKEQSEKSEELYEAIIKLLAKPKYSKL